jgi:predicted Fe-Mo cluster-binding NifX family protein
MKIAAITDDGATISQHFGRARNYMVLTVAGGEITNREMRPKAGHHDFAHEGGHDHEHGEGKHAHGFGEGAAHRHEAMISAITDCDVVLVRGMGRGAYMALQEAKIEAIVTDIADIEQAAQAYLDGSIVNHLDRLH